MTIPLNDSSPHLLPGTAIDALQARIDHLNKLSYEITTELHERMAVATDEMIALVLLNVRLLLSHRCALRQWHRLEHVVNCAITRDAAGERPPGGKP